MTDFLPNRFCICSVVLGRLSVGLWEPVHISLYSTSLMFQQIPCYLWLLFQTQQFPTNGRIASRCRKHMYYSTRQWQKHSESPQCPRWEAICGKMDNGKVTFSPLI